MQLRCERAIHLHNESLHVRDQDQDISIEFVCVRILSQL